MSDRPELPGNDGPPPEGLVPVDETIEAKQAEQTEFAAGPQMFAQMGMFQQLFRDQPGLNQLFGGGGGPQKPAGGHDQQQESSNQRKSQPQGAPDPAQILGMFSSMMKGQDVMGQLFGGGPQKSGHDQQQHQQESSEQQQQQRKPQPQGAPDPAQLLGMLNSMMKGQDVMGQLFGGGGHAKQTAPQPEPPKKPAGFYPDLDDLKASVDPQPQPQPQPSLPDHQGGHKPSQMTLDFDRLLDQGVDRLQAALKDQSGKIFGGLGGGMKSPQSPQQQQGPYPDLQDMGGESRKKKPEKGPLDFDSLLNVGVSLIGSALKDKLREPSKKPNSGGGGGGGGYQPQSPSAPQQPSAPRADTNNNPPKPKPKSDEHPSDVIEDIPPEVFEQAFDDLIK